jgi:hypothetical protein
MYLFSVSLDKTDWSGVDAEERTSRLRPTTPSLCGGNNYIPNSSYIGLQEVEEVHSVLYE